MSSLTNLSLHESDAPRTFAIPENFSLTMPTLWQWVKAGVGLAFGAWLAAVVLYIPTMWLLLRAWVAILGALAGRI